MSAAATAAATEAPDILAAARAYVARGWAVVPLPPRAKAPGIREWQRLRLEGPDLERAFAAAGGVGIQCGAPSGGACDVDLDSAETRDAWPLIGPPTEMRHGRASSPESHAWYQLDAPPAQTERLRDPDGKTTLIELRSTGGQTVVHPSLHEETGEAIVWHADGEPAHVDVVDLQRAVRECAAVAMVARRWPTGSRHDAALALAGLLLRGGKSVSDAERLVEIVARVAGDAEVADRVRAVRDTAVDLEAGRPATGGPRLAALLGSDGEAVVGRLREWLGLTGDGRAEDDDAAPLDLWGSQLAGTPPLHLPTTVPTMLADVAEDVAARHGCDDALVAMFGLAVCAGAIDDGHQIQPRQHDREWRTSARLWNIGAEEIGHGKSPALRAVLGPLRALDHRWGEEDAPAHRRYALALKLYNRELERWVKGGGVGLPPTEPPRPPARRRVVDDITIEKLSDVLADNSPGVLIAQDEIAGLIGGMDAYRPNGVAKDQAAYLQLRDGGPRRVERVKRGDVTCSNWGASLVGGIQPAKLRQLAPRMLDDGLLARCLVFFGRGGGLPIDRPADRAALDLYAATIERLAVLPVPAEPYRMAAGAHLRREYVVRIARAVAVLPTTAPGLAAALSKWEGLFAQLALTMHLTEAASEGRTPAAVVSEGTADRVARLLIDYVLPHTAHLYGELLGQDHLTHARWLAGHILAHRLDKISARDIGRAYHGMRDDRRALQDAMQTLTVAGWVMPRDEQPGRGATKWRVNPRVHALFGARAEAERIRRDAVRDQIKQAAEMLGLSDEVAP